jgi:hypothetical protein
MQNNAERKKRKCRSRHAITRVYIYTKQFKAHTPPSSLLRKDHVHGKTGLEERKGDEKRTSNCVCGRHTYTCWALILPL